MPPTPDLSFTGLVEFVNELVVENNKAMSSEEEPKVVRKNDDAWNGYLRKRRKTKPKRQTGLGMEKTVKDKAKSKPKSQ
ncbi:hypothetical protein Tco_0523590 [Tanacetum coccineum]